MCNFSVWTWIRLNDETDKQIHKRVVNQHPREMTLIQVSEMEERTFYSLSSVTVYYCNTFYRNVINNCNSVILFAFFVELTNHTACSYVKVETNTWVWSSFMEVLVVLCITFFFSVSLSRRRNCAAKRSVDLELIHVPMFLS